MANLEWIATVAIRYWLSCASVTYENALDAEGGDPELIAFADEQFDDEDVDDRTRNQFLQWSSGLVDVVRGHGVDISDEDLAASLGGQAGGVGDPLVDYDETYPEIDEKVFSDIEYFLDNAISYHRSAAAYRDKNGKLKVAAE